MKNRKRLVLFVLCLLGALALGVAVNAAEDKGKETTDIDTNGKGKHVKGFKHREHQKRSKCVECHHAVKGKVKPKKCGTCHTDVKAKDPKTGAPGFKKAFHDTCKKCHKKHKEKPELKKCKTCHPK